MPFDAVHDQTAGVLRTVFEALEPGGIFVMFDIRASSQLEKNIGNPLAPWLYAISTLHCMTVSLADGGAGLGTAWGEELAPGDAHPGRVRRPGPVLPNVSPAAK